MRAILFFVLALLLWIASPTYAHKGQDPSSQQSTSSMDVSVEQQTYFDADGVQNEEVTITPLPQTPPPELSIDSAQETPSGFVVVGLALGAFFALLIAAFAFAHAIHPNAWGGRHTRAKE